MIIGEDAGLECKTTSALNLKKFKGGEYPENYYCQCMHYMAVTGCKKWYLAVLVLGEGFYDFTIERDEGEIKALMDAEREFWGFVERKTPPPTDGLKSTTEAISVLYPEDNGNSVSLTAYELYLAQYMNLTASIKHLEKCRDEAANKVKAFLGESARGETDRFKVSWTSTSRSTFDSKRFAKEHPEIDLSGYYKTSAYRTFKVSENSK